METRPVSFVSGKSTRHFASIQFLVAVGFMLATAMPLIAANDDYADKLTRARLFEQPLVWVGTTLPNAKESQDLWNTFGIGRYKKLDEAINGLAAFIMAHPESPWTPSLNANLGKYYRDHGYFSLALDHWQAAWDATKDMTDSKGRQVADYTLVNWLNLLASLGRTDTMRELFSETRTRPLGPLQTFYDQSLGGYSTMLAHPEISYRCGTYALNALARALYKTNSFRDIAEQPSPTSGFSMAALTALAQSNQLNVVAVERPGGQDDLVVPSVVHWKQNHYAAIISKRGDSYEVVDPTFRLHRWLTVEAINAESSGQFLISARQVPDDWQRLTTEQTSHIFGKGYPSWFDPYPPDCSNCPCPVGTGGIGGNGNGSSGSSGSPGDGGSCGGVCVGSGSGGASGTAGGGASGSGGMPDWKVNEPNIDLRLHDAPLAYHSSVSGVSFQINYWQRDDRVPSANVFSLGPGWECSWSAYVDVSYAVIYAVNGGEIQINDTTGAEPNYYYNLLTKYDTDGGGNFIDCTVTYPSGAKDIYGFLVKDGYGNPIYAYLSQEIDAHGRTTTFVYTPYDFFTNPTVQLNYVIDADGRTNTLHYTSVSNSAVDYNYLISQVEDPYLHMVNFAYNTNGYLTNVTDVANISSSFTYGYSTNANNQSTEDYWLNSLTTPYGLTTFDLSDYTYAGYSPSVFGSITDAFGSQIIRSAIITEPNNSHQMFLYEATNGILPYAITTDIPTSPPPGSTLDGGGYMFYRNTFYWGPQQFANLAPNFQASGLTNWDFTQLTTNDYLRARLQHWNHSTGLGQSDSLSMEQDPSPDGITPGKRTWYDYAYKAFGYFFMNGLSALPSLVIKVLPDGSEWYNMYVVDLLNNRTNVISTFSSGGSVLTRTNTYIYANNGVDLLLSIGPDGVTNAAYGYDSHHQVLFMTNALGEITSYTYNGNEQVSSITRPTGWITTNLYDANGFLATTYDYAFVSGSPVYYRTNSYTYTNGLVYSHTDERGLTVTNSWDALERLTNVLYPDGTHITYIYSNLDLAKVIDRLGYTNSYSYNSIRQKTSETDALGRTTTYVYCDCGALYAITNALQQVTIFNHDNQANLLSVIYPDGYSVTNTWNSIRQLVVKADSGGNIVSNAYNNQGLLVAVSNTVGQVAAYAYDIDDRRTNSVDANGVSVGLSYDNLDRLLTRRYPDNGVETFGYTHNVSGPSSYTNQITNIVTYAYDALSRKTNEAYVGVTTNNFAYNGASDLMTLTDGKGQTTTWGYDQYGRVTNKLDANSTSILAYQYDPDNRLTNRWSVAKGTTLYRYDLVGNLTNVDYSGGTNYTSPIYFSYDALNHLTNMVDGVGTTAYGYDAAGQLLSEDGPWANDTVSYTYQNRLRTALSLSQPSGSWAQSYGYDSARRLFSVTSPAGAFGYTYGAPSTASALVDGITLPNGALITNTYDGNARLLSTKLLNSSSSILDSESYAYNQAGQRTTETSTAGDFRNYGYDKAGELTSAIGKEAGGTTNRWQEQLSYGYDAAGNLNYRTNNTYIQTFTVNDLNELSNVTRSGTITTVAGTTTTPATNVTVNGTSASLYADATFAATNVSLSNGTNTFTAVAQDSFGRVSSNTVTAWMPAAPTYAYDLNGNLLLERNAVGTITNRNFAYDDENQLIGVWAANSWSNSFAYDGKMRRRIERDYTWSGGTWIQTNEMHYIYDGNVVIQERDGNNNPLVTYTRGDDLSGTLQGAGGIGGLLARTDYGQEIPGSPTTGYYHCDGNGNVTMLIYTNQIIAAKYLYDPYGNTLSLSGPLASVNVYRFSSKEWDGSSGLYYYLYRYYDPNLQRWPNRDPLGDVRMESVLWSMNARVGINASNLMPPFEALDRPNLYTYVHNTPIQLTDALGLAPRIHIDWKSPDPPSWPNVDKNLLRKDWKRLQDCAHENDPEGDCADICGMLTSVYPGLYTDSGCLDVCLGAFHKRCDPKPPCPTK